ncbi:MAG: transporter, solute:sodium symporter family protein, partial [Lacunisphaera sp.]|nr:transporter, solute:sodium symporter family protein [Lacunisphaera sp.]
MRLLLPRLAVCVLAPLLAAGALRGENLVTIRTGTVPSLPGSPAVSRVFVLDGQPVAVSDTAAWRLAAGRTAWAQLDWRPHGMIAAVAEDIHQTFLLLRVAPGGPATAVERLGFAAGALVTKALPPLPAPLVAAQGAVMHETLYVAGRDEAGTPQLFSLDLALAGSAWAAHHGWPGGIGQDGKVTSLAGQNAALFLTYEGDPGQPGRLWRWTARDGWTDKGKLPGRVVSGATQITGQAHVLYLMQSGTSAPSLQVFHTITGSWATLAEPNAAGARSGSGWRNGIFWEKPAAGGAGSEFGFAEIEGGKVLLRWLDWIVIVTYLVAMLGMGLYFYLREKRTSTSDFFVGGRTIPFWAAGMSLYAANTSSISYIAIPAKSFETNWQYLTNNLVAIGGLIFVAIWIVPLLRRLNLMSVFQYLETRFHPVIRTLASALFMAVQIGSRMSVILFLPSLAIATITGIDVIWSILIMGVFTMIYTALGGMKAVIWTDFVQLIVKMGGIIFAIAFIIYAMKGGVRELLTIAV